ncbi:hypothetical protein ACFX1R_000684 [Malus domestica]
MARLGLISVLLVGFLLFSTMAAKKSDDLGRDTEHFDSTAAEPSSDSEKKANNSVAGGGIIITGLVTTISAAVFLYIRVTRRRGGVMLTFMPRLILVCSHSCGDRDREKGSGNIIEKEKEKDHDVTKE